MFCLNVILFDILQRDWFVKAPSRHLNNKAKQIWLQRVLIQTLKQLKMKKRRITKEEEHHNDLASLETRRPASSWCLCGNCQKLPTSQECVCCCELLKTKAIIDSEKIKCILDHESFNAVCLNKDVL